MRSVHIEYYNFFPSAHDKKTKIPFPDNHNESTVNTAHWKLNDNSEKTKWTIVWRANTFARHESIKRNECYWRCALDLVQEPSLAVLLSWSRHPWLRKPLQFRYNAGCKHSVPALISRSLILLFKCFRNSIESEFNSSYRYLLILLMVQLLFVNIIM